MIHEQHPLRMTPLRLLPIDLPRRRVATALGTSLAPLLDGLAHELDPLMAGALPIPEQKARLTRAGGRCPTHGVLLDFDPWSPHAHRCPRCDRGYTGAEHDDWWAMGAQLYSAERAVHAAACFALRGDPRHAAVATRVLHELAVRYGQWPNQDNVLGPSRPFFSTYLESIWLLNICHAVDLLDASAAPGADHVGGIVRDLLIAPSTALIASYNEGTSNRQVWNEVALLSAWRVLGDDRAFERCLDTDRSLPYLLERGLLDDGTWYEGENYHLFAHRGLWYGMQLMQAAGRAVPPSLCARFTAGFVTPFLGLLPDETLPSRRDSQYAVSIRQWRFAEWCELGYTHHPDHRIAGILARVYDGSIHTNAKARARSTADAERNEPPSALSRADLSWRALLVASPDPVPHARWAPVSVCLPDQGLAAIRREQGRVYVALEGGHSGSGHGHPDRLALTLQAGADRWLQDPGTGSYVERTLHWYRSTLAHHAPLVNGASQPAAAAQLVAFEDRGGMGWAQKRAHIGHGVVATRTVVVAEAYLVDLLEWRREQPVHGEPITVTLPLCGDVAKLSPNHFRPAVRTGAGGLEDGFDFWSDAHSAEVTPHDEGEYRVSLSAIPVSATGVPNQHGQAHVQLASSVPVTVLRAHAPGAPGCAPCMRHVVELHGDTGRVVSVWSWQPAPSAAATAVEQVTLNVAGGPLPVAQVTTRDGTTAVHGAAPHGWHIELLARAARSSIDLEGLVPEPSPPDSPRSAAKPVTHLPWSGVVHEPHYLQTEQSWQEAGAPSATVQLEANERTVMVTIDVRGRAPVAPEPGGNLLDNERAEINADGVQWYWASPHGDWSQAALCVLVNGTVQMARLVAGDWPLPTASLHTGADGQGWRVQLVWKRENVPCNAQGVVAFDLIVNERPTERRRRRGQLVLSGRTASPPLASAFSYLRGDRHDVGRAILLQLPMR